MSYWDTPRVRQRNRSITAELIAGAALAVLTERGAASLTVRAVAGELGVAAASLYAHIDSVDDLFDLALDRALASDPDVPEQQTGLAEDPVDLALATYRHLVRHPWAPSVIGQRPVRGPAYTAFSERFIVSIEASLAVGSTPPATRDAGHVLATAYAMSNLTLGSALTATAALAESQTPIDEEHAPRYALAHGAAQPQAEAVLLGGLRAILSAGKAK